MRRADWTPAVLVTASLSLSAVAAVLLTSPVLRGLWEGPPGAPRARRDLPREVTVWVGDLGEGVRGVLGAVWGDPGPDAAHDADLNEDLGLPAGTAFGWYHLLLFNTGPEPRTLRLEDGALAIAGPDGQGARLRSLPAALREGEAHVSPSLETVLRALGALEENVVLPPGRMADLVLAFTARVELGEATAVAAADGTAFRRRRIPRRQLEALVEDPDVSRVLAL